MTDDARKRIQALEQFSDWKRFNIAMKDLEIRGAGDLLGGEWFYQRNRFDTYQKIMNEAIEELKKMSSRICIRENNIETKEYVKTCKSILILSCCFDEYINNISERLSLYSELGVKNEEELNLSK
jgi:transcription-repair coupling factor (superfamily II helicase)